MTNIIKKENAQPATFGNVVDQIFQNNLSRFFDDDSWGLSGLQTRNQVPVNIRETDKSCELEVIAPGLRKQDFQLNLAAKATVTTEQLVYDNEILFLKPNCQRADYQQFVTLARVS